MASGNLIKGGYTVLNDKTKVIDSNEAVKKRLDEIKKQIEIQNEQQGQQFDDANQNETEGFVEGLDPLSIERLVSDSEDDNRILGESFEGNNEPGDYFEDNNSDNHSNSLEYDNVENENGSQLNSQEAADIINQANIDAQAIKADAQASGYEEGYNKGYKQGEEDLIKEYEQKAISLNADYENKVEEIKQSFETEKLGLESVLVEKLTDIYSKVIGIKLEDDKDFILKLINRVMSDSEGGMNYLIHVSPDDYENVKSNKDSIINGTGISSELVDIIEDNSVPENGCLIESEIGIFDCGLGTQMELLKKQLKLLSIE